MSISEASGAPGSPGYLVRKAHRELVGSKQAVSERPAIDP